MVEGTRAGHAEAGRKAGLAGLETHHALVGEGGSVDSNLIKTSVAVAAYVVIAAELAILDLTEEALSHVVQLQSVLANPAKIVKDA